MSAPPEDLAPEPGWSIIPPLGFRQGDRSFVRRDGSEDRLRVWYFRRDADNALMGKIWFGPGTQGPPAHAHGGAMASVLDDAMGISAWMAGHMVVAAEIRIRFRSMLPIGTVAILEASVAEVDGKRIKTRSELRSQEGVVFASGEGLFVHIGRDKFAELVEQAHAKPSSGDGGEDAG